MFDRQQHGIQSNFDRHLRDVNLCDEHFKFYPVIRFEAMLRMKLIFSHSLYSSYVEIN